MFGQGATHVREAAIGRPLAEIETEERELVYARDILSTVTAADVSPLLGRLSTARTSLTALNERITGEWFRKVTESDSDGEANVLAEAYNAALDATRIARQQVRNAAKATVPTSGRSKSMYDHISQAGSVDLKELILRMMASTDDPSRVLDESLACLVDLFRANCVQIKVERRRE
jgi:hypothetical protein